MIGVLYGGYAVSILIAFVLEWLLYDLLGANLFLMFAASPLLLALGLSINYSR